MEIGQDEIDCARERLKNMDALLVLRREVVRFGESSDVQLGARVRSGALKRLLPGVFIEATRWETMFGEQKMLALTLGYARRYAARRWVFSRESAAAVWGLPLFGHVGERVHVSLPPAARVQSSRGVFRHTELVRDEDVIEILGVRLTSFERTLFDLAHCQRAETGICALDAGIRRGFSVRRGQQLEAVGIWKSKQIAKLSRSRRPGVGAARLVLALADGRADSVLESVSRLHLSRLGVAHEMQVPVARPVGGQYWLDFEFTGQGIFGEVDGAIKYLDAEMRGGVSAEEIVLAEKRREDEIRGVTGKRIVRWGARDLSSTRRFADRLSAFGVAVPAQRGDAAS